MEKHLCSRFDDIQVNKTGFSIYSENSSYVEIVDTDCSGRRTQVGRRVWVLGTRIDALNDLQDSRNTEVRKKTKGEKDVAGSVEGGSGERIPCYHRRVKCSKVYIDEFGIPSATVSTQQMKHTTHLSQEATQ
jgi:hypothetical protein